MTRKDSAMYEDIETIRITLTPKRAQLIFDALAVLVEQYNRKLELKGEELAATKTNLERVISNLRKELDEVRGQLEKTKDND